LPPGASRWGRKTPSLKIFYDYLMTTKVSLINLVNEPTVGYRRFATNFCYFAI